MRGRAPEMEWDDPKLLPLNFQLWFPWVANRVQHATGAPWPVAVEAANMAHGEDLASLEEWADLAVELTRRNLVRCPGCVWSSRALPFA